MNYAVNAIVVCDHVRLVRYLYAGWLGSSHDQRVFQNSSLFQSIDSQLGGKNYIIDDSAFTPHRRVVPPFKKPQNRQLDPQLESFNQLLSSLRICIEHCIGMLKGRFQCLKEIRVRINAKKESVQRVSRLIECCVIMHNLCIDDAIPDAWIFREEDTPVPAVDAAGSEGQNGSA